MRGEETFLGASIYCAYAAPVITHLGATPGNRNARRSAALIGLCTCGDVVPPRLHACAMPPSTPINCINRARHDRSASVMVAQRRYASPHIPPATHLLRGRGSHVAERMPALPLRRASHPLPRHFFSMSTHFPRSPSTPTGRSMHPGRPLQPAEAPRRRRVGVQGARLAAPHPHALSQKNFSEAEGEADQWDASPCISDPESPCCTRPWPGTTSQ